MANNDNIKIYTAVDIERYHKGLLSSKERHDLEKAALDDPFLADALEGYATPGVKMNADLAELEKRLTERAGGAKVISINEEKERKKALPWMRIAAIVVVMLGAGWLATQFLGNNAKQDQIAKVETDKQSPNSSDTTKNVTTTGSTRSVTESSAVASNTAATTENSTTITEKISGIKTESTVTPPSSRDDIAKTTDVSDKKISPTTSPAAAETSKEGKETAGREEVTTDKDALAKAKSADKRAADTDLAIVASGPQRRSVQRDTRALNEQQQVSDGYGNYRKTYQQPNVFRVRVTDNNNRSLPFARVTNTRDNVGTYANADGLLTLTSTDSILVVEVKSQGFADNNVQLLNTQGLNQVVMQNDKLDEAVVLSNKPNAERKQRDLSANMKLNEPEPTDGWENYDLYINNNLNIPEDYKASQSKTETGTVEVSFEVDKNGNPVDIKIEKSLCKSCDKEAIRLIKQGPKWKRNAKKERTTVKVSF